MTDTLSPTTLDQVAFDTVLTVSDPVNDFDEYRIRELVAEGKHFSIVKGCRS